MRVLGLDHGAARCGLAVSDGSGTVARPLEVVNRPDSRAGLERIAAQAREVQAETIVVGLPLLTGGEEGAQAKVARSFAGRLRKLVDCEVEMFDERFTSQMADRSADAGAQSDHDALAAAHILQSYLDARTKTGGQS